MVSCLVISWHTPARLPEQNPPRPTPRPLWPLLFVFPSLFRLPIPPKSNHSPTYAAFSRNFFVSPTSAKIGGWGVFLLVSQVQLSARRHSYFGLLACATP